MKNLIKILMIAVLVFSFSATLAWENYHSDTIIKNEGAGVLYWKTIGPSGPDTTIIDIDKFKNGPGF